MYWYDIGYLIGLFKLYRYRYISYFSIWIPEIHFEVSIHNPEFESSWFKKARTLPIQIIFELFLGTQAKHGYLHLQSQPCPKPPRQSPKSLFNASPASMTSLICVPRPSHSHANTKGRWDFQRGVNKFERVKRLSSNWLPSILRKNCFQ